MWRPKNWVNYCGKGFKYGGWSPPDEYTRRVCAGIYEAGADAMLTYLLSTARKCKVVVIPDEESNEA